MAWRKDEGQVVRLVIAMVVGGQRLTRTQELLSKLDIISNINQLNVVTVDRKFTEEAAAHLVMMLAVEHIDMKQIRISGHTMGQEMTSEIESTLIGSLVNMDTTTPDSLIRVCSNVR